MMSFIAGMITGSFLTFMSVVILEIKKWRDDQDRRRRR